MAKKPQEPIVEISEYQYAAIYCAELACPGTIDRVRDYLDTHGLTRIEGGASGVHDLIRAATLRSSPNDPPLTSARRWHANTRDALAETAVCCECGQAVSDREGAAVTYSEDGSRAYHVCAGCVERAEREGMPW